MITFSDKLKILFTDFVDNYKNFFLRTLGVTLILAIICALCSALLLRFSDMGEMGSIKEISIINYFFYLYSNSGHYYITDLTKIFFAFLIAFFSIGLFRSRDTDNRELPFLKFMQNIEVEDVVYLSVTLLALSFFDYSIFQLDNYFIKELSLNASNYMGNVIFHLRIFVPLIVFAWLINYLINSQKIINFKKILFLYISLWIFNEFAFGFYIWIQSHLFRLLLLPLVNSEKYYLFESFLSIPLVAFYILGYYSAMTTSFKFNEPEEEDIHASIDV